MSFALKREREKEKKSQSHRTIFTFSISKLRSRPLILFLFSCRIGWLWRWKTLVWQLSKTHTTLNVTCIAKSCFFFLHFISNMEVMIKRNWAGGGGAICLLCRQQFRPSDPQQMLLRLVLLLIPQRRHICMCPFENIPVAEQHKDLSKSSLSLITRKLWGISFFFLLFLSWN